MTATPKRHFGGAVAFIAGVGCATATVGEDPGVEDPNAPASGGTGATASGGVSSGGAQTGAGRASGGNSGAGGRATSTAGRGTGSSTMGGSGTSAAGTGSVVGACPTPRDPEQAGAANGSSGSFATVDAVCYFIEGTFNTWNCSNLGGRTVTINGAPATCGGPLPEPVDGGYYFQFGASTTGTDYTSFYWYTS